MHYYVIRDVKADASFKLFASPTHASAMRDVTDGLRANESMAHNKADFSLIFVGDLDEHTDRWDLTDAPSKVCELSELVE